MGNDMEFLGGMLAAMIGVLAFVLIIAIVVSIVTLISYWFILKKMSEPGWKGIVPYYNMYVLYEKVWNTKMFFIWLAITLSASAVSSASAGMDPESTGSMIVGLLSTGISIASLVLNIMFSNNLSKSFGKGVGFTIGIVFLPVIFLPMLAFGKAHYIGNTTIGSATPEMYASASTPTYTTDYNNNPGGNPYDNQGMADISTNYNNQNNQNNQF